MRFSKVSAVQFAEVGSTRGPAVGGMHAVACVYKLRSLCTPASSCHDTLTSQLSSSCHITSSLCLERRKDVLLEEESWAAAKRLRSPRTEPAGLRSGGFI